MNKQEQGAFAVPNSLEAMSAITKESLNAMSSAYAGWLRNANRLQAEAIRFINERFTKDIEMMSQFATCKKPEEVIELQAKLVNGLMSDYATESAKVLALFSDVAKDGLAEIVKTTRGMQSS